MRDDKKAVESIIIIILLLLLGIFCYLNKDSYIIIEEHTDSFAPALENESYYLELHNEEEWIQEYSFAPDSKRILTGLSIRFTNVSDDISGTLRLSIQSQDKELYSKEIQSKNLVDGTYNRVSGFTELKITDLDVILQGGKMYYLKMSIHDNNSSPPTLSVFGPDTKTSNNSLHLLIDNKEKSNLTLAFSYYYKTIKNLIWIVLFLFIIMGGWIYLIWCNYNMTGVLSKLLAFILPGIMLVMLLWVNSSISVSCFKYAIVEIFLWYSFYILF